MTTLTIHVFPMFFIIKNKRLPFPFLQIKIFVPTFYFHLNMKKSQKAHYIAWILFSFFCLNLHVSFFNSYSRKAFDQQHLILFIISFFSISSFFENHWCYNCLTLITTTTFLFLILSIISRTTTTTTFVCTFCFRR